MSAAAFASYVYNKLSGSGPLNFSSTSDMSSPSKTASSTPKLTAVWKTKPSSNEDLLSSTSSFKEDGSLLRMLRTKSMPSLVLERNSPIKYPAAIVTPPSSARFDNSLNHSPASSLNTPIKSKHVNPKRDLDESYGFDSSTTNSISTPPPSPSATSPPPSRKLQRSASDGYILHKRKKGKHPFELHVKGMPSVKFLRRIFDDDNTPVTPKPIGRTLSQSTKSSLQKKSESEGDRNENDSTSLPDRITVDKKIYGEGSLNTAENPQKEFRPPAKIHPPFTSVKHLSQHFEHSALPNKEAEPALSTPKSVTKGLISERMVYHSDSPEKGIATEPRRKRIADTAYIRQRTRSEPPPRRESLLNIPVSVSKLRMQFERQRESVRTSSPILKPVRQKNISMETGAFSKERYQSETNAELKHDEISEVQEKQTLGKEAAVCQSQVNNELSVAHLVNDDGVTKIEDSKLEVLSQQFGMSSVKNLRKQFEQHTVNETYMQRTRNEIFVQRQTSNKSQHESDSVIKTTTTKITLDFDSIDFNESDVEIESTSSVKALKQQFELHSPNSDTILENEVRDMFTFKPVNKNDITIIREKVPKLIYTPSRTSAKDETIESMIRKFEDTKSKDESDQEFYDSDRDSVNEGTNTQNAKEMAGQELIAKEETWKARIVKKKVEEVQTAKKKRVDQSSESSSESDTSSESSDSEEEDKLMRAKQDQEKERLTREKAEQERIAKEKAEQERISKEKAEQKRIANEKVEQERIVKEKAEKERFAKEKAEQDRIGKENAEKEQMAKKKKHNQSSESSSESERSSESSDSEEDKLMNARQEERKDKERAEQERSDREKETAELQKEQLVGKLIGKFSMVQEPEVAPELKNDSVGSEERVSEDKQESKVGQLLEKFVNYREVDFEADRFEEDKDKSRKGRRDSDVMKLVGMFSKMNKRRSSSSSSSESDDTTADSSVKKNKDGAPVLTISPANVHGKVRNLNPDELRMFNKGGFTLDPFVRSQSLRVKKNEPAPSQKRGGSLRVKKSEPHPMSDKSKAMPKSCRQLRPDELRFFGGNNSNIYSKKSDKQAPENYSQVFWLNSQGNLKNKEQTRFSGDDSKQCEPYSSDSDSNSSILRDDDVGEEGSDEALLLTAGFSAHVAKLQADTDSEDDEAHQSMLEVNSPLKDKIQEPTTKITAGELFVPFPYNDDSLKQEQSLYPEGNKSSGLDNLKNLQNRGEKFLICEGSFSAPVEDDLQLRHQEKSSLSDILNKTFTITEDKICERVVYETDEECECSTKPLLYIENRSVQQENCHQSLRDLGKETSEFCEDRRLKKPIEDYYLVLDESKEYLSEREFAFFCFFSGIFSIAIYFVYNIITLGL